MTKPCQPPTDRKDWIRGAGFIVAFDYNVHALTATRYGEKADWKLTRQYLETIRPDLVLIQSLGYFGWSCYPSRIAPTPKGFKSRYVETFQALCRELGLRMGFLVESYQTVWVPGSRPWSKAERRRWFVVRPDMKGSEPPVFCPNGPFTDEYLIPYALECIERYQPAAYWFDHSRTYPCYCRHCQARFSERYGEPLRPPQDANQRTRIETFMDDSFVTALVRVNRVLHERDSGLVICWPNAVDTHTCRPVFAGADWISADEINHPDLRAAQFEGAYRSVLGAPAHLWVPDLARSEYPRQRPPELLRAEASTLLAHGLGMTLYHMCEPLGYFGVDDLASARVAAEFIRPRAGFCIGNQCVPHVAVVASRAQNLRIADRFQPFMPEVSGMHAILSQNHVPCEVANDNTLMARMNGYNLVVLGETRLLAPATAQAVEQYVRGGGRVLLIGRAPVVAEPDAVAPDSPLLFGLASTLGNRVVRHLFGERVAHVGRLVRPTKKTQVLWRRVEMNGKEVEPLLVRVPVGAGALYWFLGEALSEYAGPPFDSLTNALTPGGPESADAVLARMNFGQQRASRAGRMEPVADPLARLNYEDKPYRDWSKPGLPHPHLRRLLGLAVREALGPRWLIRSDAPAGVEFVVNRRASDLYVHLVNHTLGFPTTAACPYTDDFPLLADVAFELRWAAPARSIKALPDGEALSVKRTATGYKVVLARLRHHAAIRFAGAARGPADRPGPRA